MVDIVGYDEDKKKKVTCSECTAILKYAMSEVKKRVDHDYDGGSEMVHYIKCPGCGHQITVKGY